MSRDMISPQPIADTRRPWFDLPNALSLSRVGLAVVPWLVHMRAAWVAATIAVAALTDIADGWAARRRTLHQRGAAAVSMGLWLDPVCDKVFMVSLVAAAFVMRQPPWWLAAFVIARELLLVPLVTFHALIPSLRSRRIRLGARVLGKATTVAQHFAVLALVFVPRAFPSLAVLTAALGTAAVVDYVVHASGGLSPVMSARAH